MIKKITAILIVIPLVLILFTTSCSVEKRQYLSGYHIVWNKNKKQIKIEDVKLDDRKIEIAKKSFSKEDINNFRENNNEDVLVASSSSDVLVEQKKVISLFQKRIRDADCDEIILKDGTILKGKVQEIGTEEIKYKRCDNLEGPIISLKRNSVFLIKYPNGTTDVVSKIDSKEAKKSDSESIKTEPMAIASLASVSLAALTAFLFFVPGVDIIAIIPFLLFSLLGFIFSLIALVKIKKSKGELKGKSLALIGLITSAVFLILSALGVFIFI